MPAQVTVDSQEVMVNLDGVGASVSDMDAILKICGELMRTSIAYTFREEGSPAGSWPELAASTRRRKGYTAGHKLLILSGRLFGSFTYMVVGNVLTIGTDVPYAEVQQEGSKDWMGGASGPRTREQMLAIGPYAGFRAGSFKRHGMMVIRDKNGRERRVRVRHRGPADSGNRFPVAAHTRRQNIPARPFLVFRPEDPQRFVLGIEAYLGASGVRVAVGGVA